MTKQPIVPLEMPKNERNHFKQRSKNELLLRCKMGSLELSFFSSLDASQRNEILEKVFSYGAKLSKNKKYYTIYNYQRYPAIFSVD